jgi:AcrR family transcriptional regulator
MTRKSSSNPRGRPREFNEETALDAAMKVFSKKGYEATSLTDLTMAMGINRVSMYATFGNKEALFMKAMARYLSMGNRRFTQSLSMGTAREGVEKLLSDSVMMFTEEGGLGVCFVTQGPMNPSDASEETCRFVAEKRGDIERMLKQRLDQGAASGESRPDVSTADLARFYAVTIQGLALQAQHGGSRESLLRVVGLAMEVWPDLKST